MKTQSRKIVALLLAVMLTLSLSATIALAAPAATPPQYFVGIKANPAEGGKPAISHILAEEKTVVSLIAKPQPGYIFESWSTSSKAPIQWATGGATTPYSSFFMPASDMALIANYVKDESYVEGGGDNGGLTGAQPVANGAVGWAALTDAAKKLTAGGTLNIGMNGLGEIPASFLSAISGRAVTVTFDMGQGMEWVIKGSDVPSNQSAQNVAIRRDTQALVPQNLLNVEGSIEQAQLRLTHSGSFAVPMTLAIQLNTVRAGLFANLYHVADPNTLAHESTVFIDADGVARFPFTHASNFLIVISESNLAPDSDVANPFTDVAIGDKYFDDVMFVVRNGLFYGTTETTFAPKSNMTRAMIVTVLWRLAGKPSIESDVSFTDVPATAWYADATSWAQFKGIVTGVGGGRFNPNADVTRQELAVILHRYAGKPAPAGAKLAGRDTTKIDSWAVDAFTWCVENKLISLRDSNNYEPTAPATRAEVATAMRQYVER